MKVLIRTCPWHDERLLWAIKLAELTEGELIEDVERDAYDTFLRALERQGERDAWHIEDDAVLVPRWLQTARAAQFIAPRGVVIQGYNNHTAIKEPGWRPPGSFDGAVCFFVPGDQARALLDYGQTWDPTTEYKAPPAAPLDWMVRSWLRQRDKRYWLLVPSLATHRNSVSLIHPGRPRSRKAVDFTP